MRVLITGASGFVGTHLIRHLLEMEPESEIVGTVHPDLPYNAPTDSRVQFTPCDITANSGADIRSLVLSCRPDRLYHLAGAASGASVDRDAVFRVNVDGTRSVVLAAKGVVSPDRVLFAGTGYVYGPCDPARPAREDDPIPAPGQYGVYAASKTVAEEAILDCGGAVIARAFNHTGPGQSVAFSIPAFASQIAGIERCSQTQMRVGNLESERDFLDVRDVVRAYRLLVEGGTAGEIYNVCSGVTRRMSRVLDDLRALASVPIPVTVDPERMRPSDIPVSVGDNSKLTALTGWQPVIPFLQTLQDTLDWWRRR